MHDRKGRDMSVNNVTRDASGRRGRLRMSEIHRIKCGNANCYIVVNGTDGILVERDMDCGDETEAWA